MNARRLSGKVGGFISEIIDSNHGVEFKDSGLFTTLNETRRIAGNSCGGACTVGAEESLTGNTQIFVNRKLSWKYRLYVLLAGEHFLGCNSSNRGKWELIHNENFPHAAALGSIVFNDNDEGWSHVG